MQIKFLGTGGAFDFNKGTAAAIVEVNNKKILIDCGFSTIEALVRSEAIKEIDYILITHLHGDHVGSLPTLLPYFQYKLDLPIPNILVPNQKMQDEISEFLETTYELKRAHYVAIGDIPGVGFIDTTNQHVEGMTSFAYYFIENDHVIYYSGDINNAQTAKAFLDSRTESKIQVFHETTPKLDVAVHASYKEVQEKLGHYDTYVYHIAKENMPEDCTLRYVEDYPEFLY